MYSVREKNGVTRFETPDGFYYWFPKVLIRANVDTNCALYYDIAQTRKLFSSVLFYQIDPNENLGASNIVEYVDELANRGYYGAGENDTRSSSGVFQLMTDDSVNVPIGQVSGLVPVSWLSESSNTTLFTRQGDTILVAEDCKIKYSFDIKVNRVARFRTRTTPSADVQVSKDGGLTWEILSFLRNTYVRSNSSPNNSNTINCTPQMVDLEAGDLLRLVWQVESENQAARDQIIHAKLLLDVIPSL